MIKQIEKLGIMRRKAGPLHYWNYWNLNWVHPSALQRSISNCPSHFLPGYVLFRLLLLPSCETWCNMLCVSKYFEARTKPPSKSIMLLLAVVVPPKCLRGIVHKIVPLCQFLGLDSDVESSTWVFPGSGSSTVKVIYT